MRPTKFISRCNVARFVVPTLLALIVGSMSATETALGESEPFNFSYSGQLLNADGTPRTGENVRLKIEFFKGKDHQIILEKQFTVNLEQGVFSF